MDFTIQLSIEEIVEYFESMLRLDERLKSKLDLEECTEEDFCRYHDELTRLVKKYIPNYTKHMMLRMTEALRRHLQSMGCFMKTSRKYSTG